MKNLIGRGSGESIQMAFAGQGWVLVQPSEGRIAAVGAERRLRRRARATCSAAEAAHDVDDVALVGGVVHDLPRSPGTTSAPRARVPQAAWRSGSPAAAARAPVGQQPQRAGQLAAALGELVDEARRALGVGARDDERLLAERLQPRAEHVGRDPVELLLELVEAPLARRAARRRASSVQRSPTRASASASGEAGGGRGGGGPLPGRAYPRASGTR